MLACRVTRDHLVSCDTSMSSIVCRPLMVDPHEQDDICANLRVTLARRRRLLGHSSWASVPGGWPARVASASAASASGPAWKRSACKSASDTRCDSGVATLGGRSRLLAKPRTGVKLRLQMRVCDREYGSRGRSLTWVRAEADRHARSGNQDVVALSLRSSSIRHCVTSCMSHVAVLLAEQLCGQAAGS